jgi:hypothetical protein
MEEYIQKLKEHHIEYDNMIARCYKRLKFLKYLKFLVVSMFFISFIFSFISIYAFLVLNASLGGSFNFLLISAFFFIIGRINNKDIKTNEIWEYDFIKQLKTYQAETEETIKKFQN